MDKQKQFSQKESYSSQGVENTLSSQDFVLIKAMVKHNVDQSAEQMDRSQKEKPTKSEKTEGERFNGEKMAVCEAVCSSFNANTMFLHEKRHEREEEEKFCCREEFKQQYKPIFQGFPIESEKRRIRQPRNCHINMGPISFSSCYQSSFFDSDEEGFIYQRQISEEDSDITNQEFDDISKFHSELNFYIDSDEQT